MKITIIADVLGEENNGTSITATRLIANLKKRGHEVYVVSSGKRFSRSCNLCRCPRTRSFHFCAIIVCILPSVFNRKDCRPVLRDVRNIS